LSPFGQETEETLQTSFGEEVLLHRRRAVVSVSVSAVEHNKK
jgi:hypothetical protein